MKRGTPNHKKMYALAEALNIRQHAAAGIMEMLWHFGGDNTPEGDIGSIPDRKIAEALDWRGGPKKLIDALAETKWLDRNETFRLIIHDWPQHAEYEVCRKLIKSGKDFLSIYGVSVHDRVKSEKLRGSSAQMRALSEEMRGESEDMRASREAKAVAKDLGSFEIQTKNPESTSPRPRVELTWEGSGFDSGEHFSVWFSALYAKHPTKNDFNLGSDYLRAHFVVKRTFTRERFEEIYTAMRASRAWTRDGGRGCPKLSTWCVDDGCAYMPTEIADEPATRPARRSVMDGVKIS